jgi:hypothetical protein
MPSAAEWELIARKAIDIERERDTEQYIVDRGKRPPRRGRKPVGPAERHLYVDMLAQEMITRKVSLTKASEVIGERIGRTGKQVRGYFRDSREYIITAYPQLVGK